MVKIKNDLKYESRESIDGLEARMARKLQDLSEDLEAARAKWDKDFTS